MSLHMPSKIARPGKRILEENDNFERKKIYGKEIVSRVSISLGKSRQTIHRVIQFVKKYPDLNMLPEGKNMRKRVCVFTQSLNKLW